MKDIAKYIFEWVSDAMKGVAMFIMAVTFFIAGANLHQPVLKYQQMVGVPTLQQLVEPKVVEPLPSPKGDLPLTRGDRLNL